MKASELRLGNYVYRQSSKLIVSKSDVYRIENVNIQSALKYNPIALTEEWLLKFDIEEEKIEHYVEEENRNGIVKRYGNEYISIGVDKDGQYFFLHIGANYNEEEEYYLIGNPFLFVHQLQNLYFALTGEELQLK